MFDDISQIKDILLITDFFPYSAQFFRYVLLCLGKFRFRNLALFEIFFCLCKFVFPNNKDSSSLRILPATDHVDKIVGYFIRIF